MKASDYYVKKKDMGDTYKHQDVYSVYGWAKWSNMNG